MVEAGLIVLIIFSLVLAKWMMIRAKEYSASDEIEVRRTAMVKLGVFFLVVLSGCGVMIVVSLLLCP